MTALTTISRPYTGGNHVQVNFHFRKDGWFNMTAAAQAFGKRLDHFWENLETQQYVDALKKLPGIPGSLLATVQGRNGGTWAHPKLAVFFARWLDVRFAVWCDDQIEKILKGEVKAPAVSEQQYFIRRG